MRVSDIMKAGPVCVPIVEPIAGCGAAMVRGRIRHLPVVDAAGALAGVLTDHHVFRHGGFVDRAWLSFEPEYDALTAGDLARPVDVVAGPEDDLDAVLRRLCRTPQDVVVVVDERRHPVGILTEHDAVGLALAMVPEDLLAAKEGTSPVLTVPRTEPARVALDHMVRRAVRHLVVTGPDGSVCGVVSYGDLVADDVSRRPDLLVEDVVRSARVVTAPADARLKDVARTLHDQQIGCVPVVGEDGRAVAIVTRRDVLDAAVSALDAEDLF